MHTLYPRFIVVSLIAETLCRTMMQHRLQENEVTHHHPQRQEIKSTPSNPELEQIIIDFKRSRLEDKHIPDRSPLPETCRDEDDKRSSVTPLCRTRSIRKLLIEAEDEDLFSSSQPTTENTSSDRTCITRGSWPGAEKKPGFSRSLEGVCRLRFTSSRIRPWNPYNRSHLLEQGRDGARRVLYLQKGDDIRRHKPSLFDHFVCDSGATNGIPCRH
jgi:hypothetical protein